MAFTVTDLDASQRFYTEVLDFVVVMDVGYGRICMHPGTGFAVTLLKHEGAHSGSFTELNTGLDHLGLVPSSREEAGSARVQQVTEPPDNDGVPGPAAIDRAVAEPIFHGMHAL